MLFLVTVKKQKGKKTMDELKKFLAKHSDLTADEIEPDTKLADLGIDSMKLFSIIAEFENEFNVKVSDKQLGELFTVNDLCNVIKAQKN